MENWAEIPEFPGYSVSDYGWVRNDDTGLTLVHSRNQHNVLHVGLYKGGTQYRRSVTVLVANAFLEPHREERFDTPIQLDGDIYNTAASNLDWRPRWFARQYKQQYTQAWQSQDPYVYYDPIIEVNKGEIFEDYWKAARKYGLLVKDIRVAIINRTYVFPTFQMFELL